MEIRFTLLLPRDALSVPVVRRVLATSMTTLGVDPTCVADIEIALTEACTNVLDHTTGDDEYEVVAGLDDNTCSIQVVDTGRGFDAAHLGYAQADPSAEEGRGIQLMRSLVDRVHFDSRPEAGMVVQLEKTLRFVDNAPVRRLAERTPLQSELDLNRASAAIREAEDALADLPDAHNTNGNSDRR